MLSPQALPVPALVVDPAGRVVAASPDAEAMFGAGVVGTPVAALLPAEPDGERRLRDVAGRRRTLRLQAHRRNGVPFSVDVRVGVADGRGDLLCIWREVRGRDLLDESRRYLDVSFESAPIGMALLNTDGEYERVNTALCTLLGRTADDLLGRRDQELTHHDDRAADLDAAERILRGDQHTHQAEKRFVRLDGSVVWVIANLTFLRDEAGRPLCWLGQFQDITARKADEDRLQHLANHDALTGLANRRRLLEELDSRLRHARRYGERGAVLVLDLDGFKAVNDVRGHAAGDALLVRAARAFGDRLRDTDLCARLGGDEFAVVLPHADEAAGSFVAAKLLSAVAALDAGVTASCGVATYGPPGFADADDLLLAADRAMYEVKRAGRNAARVAALA